VSASITDDGLCAAAGPFTIQPVEYLFLLISPFAVSWLSVRLRHARHAVYWSCAVAVALATFCIEFVLYPQVEGQRLTIRHHIIQFLVLVLSPIAAVFALMRREAIQSRWFAIFVIGPVTFAVALFIGAVIGLSLGWFGDSL
jgi:hypothetical protein